MEKYSQYRDKGSGIAPFFPVPTEPSGILLPFHVFLFLCRLPIIITFLFSYFCFLQWLPIGSLGKKAALWCIIGTPGIWWVDLQIDGVKRGSLASNSTRLPQPGTIIAASHTSPLDALYLAAIFDPIFTISYPTTRLVRRISLLHALVHAFSQPKTAPPDSSSKNQELVDLPTLLARNPHRPIVVFPECTTTNGRGILPFSPSLLTAPPRTKIYPISLRYTAADITTPVPGSYISFAWNLLSKPTHVIRVRIAEVVYNTSSAKQQPHQSGLKGAAAVTGIEKDLSDSTDTLQDSEDSANNNSNKEVSGLNSAERNVLDRIGEALARLGRVKRVGLGVKEKADFVKAWDRQQKRKGVLN